MILKRMACLLLFVLVLRIIRARATLGAAGRPFTHCVQQPEVAAVVFVVLFSQRSPAFTINALFPPAITEAAVSIRTSPGRTLSAQTRLSLLPAATSQSYVTSEEWSSVRSGMSPVSTCKRCLADFKEQRWFTSI